MNFLEGKVEWHGNGVVVIRERSLTQSVWRFCMQLERQLYFAIRSAVSAGKNLFAQQPLNVGPLKDFAQVSTKANVIKKIQAANRVERVSTPIPAELKKHYQVAPLAGTLTEIRRYTEVDSFMVDSGDGQSILQQLLPALAGFCHDRWLVLVSPIQRPDAAALSAAGIDPSRVLLVHARDANGLNNNGLKVVEQALESGTCGAVVAWLEECDTPTLQRLRSAAVAGHAWGVMFREGEKETAQLEMGIN